MTDDEKWGTVQPEAWLAHAYGGVEPLPDAIVQAARDYGLDVNELHDYVDGYCGWEAHDEGYAEAVKRLADTMKAGQ